MWLLSSADHPVLPLQWCVVIGASLVAAVTDVQSRRIPNLLSLPLLATGLVWAASGWGASGGGLAGLGEALLSCLLLAFPFVLLFAFGGGGAGDAKLMGGIGAWLGLHDGVIALGSVCVFGIALAVVFAVARRRVGSAMMNLGRFLRSFSLMLFSKGELREVATGMLPETSEMQTLPYAPAIFLGVAASAVGVYLWSA